MGSPALDATANSSDNQYGLTPRQRQANEARIQAMRQPVLVGGLKIFAEVGISMEHVKSWSLSKPKKDTKSLLIGKLARCDRQEIRAAFKSAMKLAQWTSLGIQSIGFVEMESGAFGFVNFVDPNAAREAASAVNVRDDSPGAFMLGDRRVKVRWSAL